MPFVLRLASKKPTAATDTVASMSASRSAYVRRARLSALALLFSTFAFACDGPCKNLAEYVCSCEPNRTEENACLLKIRLRADTPVSQAEADRCDELLPECTCNALENQDYAACGLSNGPVPTK